MHKEYLKNKNSSSGYTLLFAVLVSSLVLAIGVSVLTLSKKEFLLSASSRDSTLAIYAATSALECFVLSEDQKGSQGLGEGDFYTSGLTANCGSEISTPVVTSAPTVNSLTFSSRVAYPYVDNGVNIHDNSCATVYVLKTLRSGRWFTVIESRGYNIGWNGTDCSAPSAKKVERGVRLTY